VRRKEGSARCDMNGALPGRIDRETGTNSQPAPLPTCEGCGELTHQPNKFGPPRNNRELTPDRRPRDNDPGAVEFGFWVVEAIAFICAMKMVLGPATVGRSTVLSPGTSQSICFGRRLASASLISIAQFVRLFAFPELPSSRGTPIR
jgi:hypothetical protein